ncbi:carboxypeptidase-like regulatory domain-containing protein [Flavobacterium sp. PLA-1-15]|uniref:carboxypeptidase-like regulatory domain-containing protein n=1 Tax=Flavobacterium sp. PLA-1-15 TaxID=3380533 RepID=UPI003B7993E9
MSVAEKGRFCTSCQKDVFDFTNSSDREIANALKNNKNICGRFNVSQVNRELILPSKKNSPWIIIATSAISFLELGNIEMQAQETITIEQTDTKKPHDRKTKLSKEKDSLEVSGTIYDEQNIPLPGASIHIKNTLKINQTDFNGNFTIKVKEGDKLSISYIGYKTEELIISSRTKALKISLQAESILLGEVGCQRRTFFGRIFNSIGNIFR